MTVRGDNDLIYKVCAASFFSAEVIFSRSEGLLIEAVITLNPSSLNTFISRKINVCEMPGYSLARYAILVVGLTSSLFFRSDRIK